MKKNRLLATLAAIGLAMASFVGVAAPAAADETTDSGITTSTETTSTDPAPVVDDPVVVEPEVIVEPEIVVVEPEVALETFLVIDETQPVDNENFKVYVCKYTQTPGEPEELQGGQNPIEVSVNAIPNYQGVGSSFSDNQGRSYVLGVVGEIDEPDIDDCPQPTPDDVALASVSTTPATCESPEVLVLGAIVNATWGSITNPDGPDDFSVTATADEGAKFAGNLDEVTFTGDLDEQLSPESEECLETLGPVLPTVVFNQITCDADGSYVLGGALEGDADKVEWTVNGVDNIPSGSYAVNTTKTVTVVAHAIQPDALEFDWVDPEPFDFVVPTGCDLETLALTGSSAPPPWALNVAVGVLVLGAGMLLLRRREESLFE